MGRKISGWTGIVSNSQPIKNTGGLTPSGVFVGAYEHFNRYMHLHYSSFGNFCKKQFNYSFVSASANAARIRCSSASVSVADGFRLPSSSVFSTPFIVSQHMGS